jgi:hypothetical protein
MTKPAKSQRNQQLVTIEHILIATFLLLLALAVASVFMQ